MSLKGARVTDNRCKSSVENVERVKTGFSHSRYWTGKDKWTTLALSGSMKARGTTSQSLISKLLDPPL